MTVEEDSAPLLGMSLVTGYVLYGARMSIVPNANLQELTLSGEESLYTDAQWIDIMTGLGKFPLDES